MCVLCFVLFHRYWWPLTTTHALLEFSGGSIGVFQVPEHWNQQEMNSALNDDTRVPRKTVGPVVTVLRFRIFAPTSDGPCSGALSLSVHATLMAPWKQGVLISGVFGALLWLVCRLTFPRFRLIFKSPSLSAIHQSPEYSAH
jgi:hypothetical protein